MGRPPIDYDVEVLKAALMKADSTQLKSQGAVLRRAAEFCINGEVARMDRCSDSFLRALLKAGKIPYELKTPKGKAGRPRKRQGTQPAEPTKAEPESPDQERAA